ncbi:hypothetical protein H0H92_015190, partial [Tricholoma furcatifolium]
SWFNRAAKPDVRSSTNKAFDKLAKIGSGGRDISGRAPQLIEVYMTHFQDLWKDHPSAQNLGKHIDERRKAIGSIFNDETQENLAKVEEKYKELKDTRKTMKEAEKLARANGNATQRTPEEYHQALEHLPSAIKGSVGTIADATGWTFLVLAAGPNPKANGNIYMHEFCYGASNVVGADFPDAYADYEEKVRTPFAKHVAACY